MMRGVVLRFRFARRLSHKVAQDFGQHTRRSVSQGVGAR